jgi:hypothetical protein
LVPPILINSPLRNPQDPLTSPDYLVPPHYYVGYYVACPLKFLLQIFRAAHCKGRPIPPPINILGRLYEYESHSLVPCADRTGGRVQGGTFVPYCRTTNQISCHTAALTSNRPQRHHLMLIRSRVPPPLFIPFSNIQSELYNHPENAKTTPATT